MTSVRVMTWNVHGAARPDLGGIAEVVRRFEPDIVAVQEIQSRQARQLARRLGHRHRWARKHFPYGVLLWWRAEGLAVLSPHHVEARHRYLLSPGAHAWTYRRRIALRVKVLLPGLTVRVFNTHLASQEAMQERIDQVVMLTGVIAEERRRAEGDGEPFRAVVAGDLNAHDEPEVLAHLTAARFMDAWEIAERRTGEPGWTCTTEEPSRRIDYVLVDEEGHCHEAHVPTTDRAWRALSDHLPVFAHLRMG